MPIAPLLQRFVDDELARAATLAEQVRLETVEALNTARADPALPPAAARHELQLGHDAAQALGRQAERYGEAFVHALREGVQARLAETPPHAPPPSPSGLGALLSSGALSLMDETQIESDIDVSRAALVLQDAVEWEQRELQTFTSALRGETHVGPDANPFAPEAYARALWRAAAALTRLAPAGQRLLLRTSAAVLAPRLKLVYAAACTRLEAQGVEPSLYRTQAFRSGGVVDARFASGTGRRPVYDVTRPGALEDLLGGLPAAGAPAPPARPPATPPPAAGAAPSLDRRIVELLSRLFDALLADPLLPAAAKTAIGRLQASALRVALRDPGLLHAHDHPTWQLMDRIADAVQAADTAALPEVSAFCDALVDDLARQPAPDAALYRRALERFDAWAAERLESARRTARPAIEQLEQAERQLRLQAFVRSRLEEQLGAAPVPSAVRRFLLGPWAALIAGTMLRSGERGDATARYTRTVDELLWSLEPPVDAVDRQRLMRLLPGLLQSLRDGMAQLGMPAQEQQAFLDELMAVHADTLRVGAGAAPVQPRSGADEHDESPADIVRRLREETSDAGPTTVGGARGGFLDTVLDVPALDTVPAELLPAAAPDAAADSRDAARRWADALAPGDAARLWLAGRWLDARLLWRSAGGELLLFDSSSGAATHALTRRALERLHAEGLAARPARVSLIQRAVDGLMEAQPPAAG